MGKNKTHEKRTPLDKLNANLASESLTVLKETGGVFKSFRVEGFQYVEIGNYQTSLFSQKVRPSKTNDENVLLAIFPPQMKPKGQFGLSEDDLSRINKQLANKQVIIYLFGNPFVLNLFDFNKTKAVVLAYQNFEVFQANAVKHFLGGEKTNGSLPVRLNSSVK